MAVQSITIAKLGGKPGREVYQMARRWASLRRDKEDGVWGTGNWPKKIEKEIVDFATQIRSKAIAPEMLYFSEHIDQWSVGCGLFDMWLPEPSRNRMVVLSAGVLYVFYPLPDDGTLIRFLHGQMRRKLIRNRDNMEARWFLVNLQEAVYAWEKLISSATLVLMQESFTVSPSDAQVKAACARPWVSKPLAHPGEPASPTSRILRVPLG